MTTQPHKTLADQIHDIYKQLPDCGLKTHLAQWFELRGASQFVKKDDEINNYCITVPYLTGLGFEQQQDLNFKKDRLTISLWPDSFVLSIDGKAVDIKFRNNIQELTTTLKIYQSTAQQPAAAAAATINWLTDDQISERAKQVIPNDITGAAIYMFGAHWVQELLKERVNCVDVKDLLNFLRQYHELSSVFTNEQLIEKYLFKTSPNGQAK